jgi:hypothetical protein
MPCKDLGKQLQRLNRLAQIMAGLIPHPVSAVVGMWFDHSMSSNRNSEESLSPNLAKVEPNDRWASHRTRKIRCGLEFRHRRLGRGIASRRRLHDTRNADQPVSG